MIRLLVFFLTFQSLVVFAQNFQITPLLYAPHGNEYEIEFSAIAKTRYRNLEEFQNLSEENLEQVKVSQVAPLFRYMMGVLTHHSLAAPRSYGLIELHTDEAFLKEGFVFVPFTAQGTWLLYKKWQATNAVPLPFDEEGLFVGNWRACGDSDPEHQTRGFYWYFWDPTRPGCSHREGVHFQNVEILLQGETAQTENSFPEYDRMIKNVNGQQTLPIAFAFGYVSDASQVNPDRDSDSGAAEYRSFLSSLRRELGSDFKETRIKPKEVGSWLSEGVYVGSRFEGVKDGVLVQIKVYISAGVDQMDLFAKSFAQDHDSYFAWLGHSRVGSGFDAQQFERKIKYQPDTYTMTDDYQLIYWGGCNSYTYYTDHFFNLKSRYNQTGDDPEGTKNLDIISNGLPSYFSLNAINAMTTVRALLNWQNPTSYQSITQELENNSARWGIYVLANVLGDEDNQ